MIVRKGMELLRRNTMFKKIIFNTITLTTLLFSCCQLQAHSIADDIVGLKSAQLDITKTYNIESVSFKEKTRKVYPVKYRLLGACSPKKEKSIISFRERQRERQTTKKSISFREYKERKNIYLIQLPCIAQTGALCGSCAFENSKILARKDLKLLTTVTELNSPSQKIRISSRAKKFKDWVDFGTVQKAWVKQTGETLLPAQYFQRFHYLIKDLYPVHAIQTENQKISLGPISYTNFAQSRNPVEVFMINVADVFGEGHGHFITARVEKTRHGDIAILFADSLYGNIINESPKYLSRLYREIFKDLVKKLGYNVR